MKIDEAAALLISIHALLAEGDGDQAQFVIIQSISIHALLAEGDLNQGADAEQLHTISIHALLAEGDIGHDLDNFGFCDFYPRPPCGGRLYKAKPV